MDIIIEKYQIENSIAKSKCWPIIFQTNLLSKIVSTNGKELKLHILTGKINSIASINYDNKPSPSRYALNKITTRQFLQYNVQSRT